MRYKEICLWVRGGVGVGVVFGWRLCGEWDDMIGEVVKGVVVSGIL